ncbi:PRD domain-containing protein [Effusibacillus consociatus]|uniref:PRD domain-containing protein n=1 Tax=Effusibacillus consociatus TaxID=1117041 RepID=A0ABV9Q083_9BACL
MIERKIVHVLSHNVVLAKLSSGKNSIVFGKGIGYQKKPGMMVLEADITQEFLLHTSEAIEHYEQLLQAVDFKIIGVTEEVIAFAQEQLEGDFSDTIHAALVDHINFAIERHKRGIEFTNPFTYEIKHLYPDEYKVASESVDYLNNRLNVSLPEDEVAFLAMHFHAARRFEKSSDSLSVVRVVSKIIDQAKEVGLGFDDSFSTLRFITHLKGLIDRVKSEKTIRNPLMERIREEYPESYNKARVLSGILEDYLNRSIPEDEIGFLTMHIERLDQRNTGD